MRSISATIESNAFPQPVELYAYRGREAISELFAFDLHVVCKGGELQVDKVMGAPGVLTLSVDGTAARTFHGLFDQCVDLFETEAALTRYRLRFVPAVSELSLVTTMDIFMDMTVGELLTHKLGRSGLILNEHFELRLGDQHDKREFVVQFDETDLAFVSRQTEHLGLTFFFEEVEDATRLIFGDGNHAFGPIGTEDGKAPFMPRGEKTGVFQISGATTMIPATYVQRDYNYRTPTVDLTAMAQLERGDVGAVYEYGGHFKTPEEAERIATIRSQERLAQRETYEARSVMPEMRAGAKLELVGHPRGDMSLIITSVEHSGRQGFEAQGEGTAEYENCFTAISSAVVYRAPRRTPKPRVSGFLTGLIESEDQQSEYAEVDDQGRYRVRFVFDTVGEGERQASRPIRMMQPHTGAGYGMHFPLRNGVEVLIGFVGGDPDRPFIAGTIPNPLTSSPVNAKNRERNIIRTGAGNEINLDDTSGSERIKLTTPYLSTTFQLGSPNAAEKGANLTTQGAYSQVATGGIASAGGFEAAFATLGNFSTSATLVSTAGTPGPWDALVGTVEVATSLLKAASSIITADRNKMLGDERALAETANAQHVLAQATQEGCEDCDTLLAALAADDDYKELVKSYQDAKEAEDVAYLALIGVMEDRNAIIIANREGTNPNFVVQMQQDVEDAQIAYDYALYENRSKNDYYTGRGDDPEATESVDAKIGTRRGEQPKPSRTAQTDTNAAYQALKDKLASDTDPKASERLAELEKCETCTKKTRQARTEAIKANDTYAESMLDHRAELQFRRRQELNCEHAQQAADSGSILFSPIAGLYGAYADYKAVRGVKKRWEYAFNQANAYFKSAKIDLTDLETAGKAITPQMIQLPFRRRYANVIGSQHTAALYGQKDAAVWGEHVLIMGAESKKLPTSEILLYGTAAFPQDPNSEEPTIQKRKGHVSILGNDDVRVMSLGEIDIAARDDLNIESNVIHLTGWKRGPTSDQDEAVLHLIMLPKGCTRPDSTTLRSSAANKILLNATGGPESNVEAGVAVSASTKSSVALHATSPKGKGTATISGAKITLAQSKNALAQTEISSKQIKSAVAGNELTLTAEALTVGPKATPQMSISPKEIKLASDKVTLGGGTQLTITAPKIDLGGTEIVQGNLLVKKDAMDASLTALRQELGQVSINLKKAEQDLKELYTKLEEDVNEEFYECQEE